MRQEQAAGLNVSEIATGLLVAIPAGLMLTAYLVDAAGWPIEPTVMAFLLVGELAVAAGLVWKQVGRPGARLDRAHLAGFVLVVIGFAALALWLAAPSLLPRTHSGDTVNHLALIDFIRHHRSLVHDRGLQYYLADMAGYPPGSHILGALVAAWLNTTAVRVLHGILAFFIAVKTGLVYNIVLRLLPPSRPNPAFALAGAALLLVAFEYFIGPLLRWGFYSQVISETFVVAMLWAFVRFDQQPSTAVVVFFALCGLAVSLTWTGLLPIPLLAFTGLVLIRRRLALRDKARWLLMGVVIVAVLATLDALSRREVIGIVASEGSVLRPSVEAYGWPLLMLGGLGLAISARQDRLLPVVVFLAALLAQVAGLWIVQTWTQTLSYYVIYKTLYLLVYPLAVFGAIALASLWSIPERFWQPARRKAWGVSAMVLPVAVLALVVGRKPTLDWPSAIREPFYEAGLWARQQLPNGCVDYVFGRWPAHRVTVLWMEVNVFGNPMESSRTNRSIDKFRHRHNGRDPWTDPEMMPFAIVGDWPALPRAAKDQYVVLYMSTDGSSTVVQRRGAANSACQDDVVTIDRLVLDPRNGTVADRLAALLRVAQVSPLTHVGTAWRG
jgi:hypothetical protein